MPTLLAIRFKLVVIRLKRTRFEGRADVSDNVKIGSATGQHIIL